MSAKYNSVRECAEDFIKSSKESSNNEIAEQVRKEMKSQTTPGCISWYKSKLNSTEISSQYKNDDIEVILNDEEEYINDYEEQILDNEAEAYFYEYVKTQSKAKDITKEKPGVGYDFKIILQDTSEMHVEVKGKRKGKISWLQLTSRETEALLNDKDFFLCLIDQEDSDRRITIIERVELFSLMKIKLHARLNGLSAERKRESWDVTKYF